MGKTQSLVRHAVAHLALLTLLTGTALAADDAPEVDVNPTVDPTLPPDFSTVGIANQGNVFKDCRGQVKDALTQGLQQIASLFGGKQDASSAAAMAAGNFGLNTECTGSELVPGADTLTCQSLAPGTGLPTPAALKAKEQMIFAAMSVLQCKKLKFAAARGELNCLSTESNQFAQQVSSIQGAYQQNIQRMQNDIQKINTVASDRCTQTLDVISRLGEGDPAPECERVLKGGNQVSRNGSKGLIQVRDGLCAALNGVGCGSVGVGGGAPDTANSIPGQIRALQTMKRGVENTQKKLDVAIVHRTMGIAAQCFTKDPVPQYHCAKGVDSPSVSPLDAISCLFEQKLAGTDSEGRVDASALKGKGVKKVKNSTRAQELKTLLAGILREVPQEVPLDSQGNPDPSKVRAPTLVTAADIDKRFGAELDKFNDMPRKPGEDTVRDFVKKAMTVCFANAKSIVDTEKGDGGAGSPIHTAQVELDEAKEQFDGQASTTLAAGASRYEEAMTALTGVNFPLGTEKCAAKAAAGEGENAARQRKIGCMEDLQKNMTGLLKGSIKESTVNMSLIGGTDPKTNLFFQCQGLNGCIASLQSVDRNLKKEVKRVLEFKNKFVKQANQSVDSFTKKMVDVMSVQNTALNTRFTHLNNAFRSLGVNLLTPKLTDCEPPGQPDEDGLMPAPQNAMKLIGCQMNPRMVDVNDNEFQASLAGLGDAEAMLAEKAVPINEAMNKLGMLKVECKAEAMSKRMNSLASDTDQWVSGNCDTHEAVCDDKGSLSTLATSLSGIEGIGLDQAALGDIGATLNAGLANCDANRAKDIKARAIQAASDVHFSKCETAKAKAERLAIDANRDKEKAENDKDVANIAKADKLLESIKKDKSDACSDPPTAPPGNGLRVPASNCAMVTRNIKTKMMRIQAQANGGADAGSAR